MVGRAVRHTAGMAGPQPDGAPAPRDGSLPDEALARMTQPFGIYLHVPFCSVRCGYCDFNTYAPAELPGAAGLAAGFADQLVAELELARRVLPDAGQVDTVFVGGGTPTLLPAADLVRVLDAVRARFGLAEGAELTTEANPDSVTPATLAALAEGGFTRVSLGMQSAVPHVLRTLDRTHDPDNVEAAVSGARAAGLQVSLDLIYGTPGESLADWERSLRAATDLAPDHLSAYALVVEEGTRLAAQVRRGLVPAPEDDDEADKYELADALLRDAGYHWYEVSNWATSEATRCRHNEGYWLGGSWWGAGPGAHSHFGGLRWWNVRHPGGYAARLAQRCSPAAGRELLTQSQRYDEWVLLGIRHRRGLAVSGLAELGQAAVAPLVAEGLLRVEAAAVDGAEVVVLTRAGRLLADTVVRRLLGVVAS